MGRKVSVGLVADVGEFIRNMLGAQKSVDDLGDEVAQLDKELDKLPGDAARAAAALKLLDGDAKSVGKTVNDLGEKNTGLTLLDLKIRETQKEVKKLGEEFLKTGDIDVFRKLGDAEGRLRGLKDTRKKLAEAIIPSPDDAAGFWKKLLIQAEEFGNKIGQMLPASISGALANPVAGPIIAGALIAVLVAAMTTVLANVGGIVLAAGGLGVVGAGVMGAILGDPGVTGAAWKTAIGTVKDEFLSATSIFRGPLIDAAHQFASVIGGIDFGNIFAKAATYLQPLTASAAAFARYLGMAVGYLTDGAAPVMQAIAEELPKIGHAIATASKSIADGGEGGAAALKDLFGIIEIVIAGIGGMIGAAEKFYLLWHKIVVATGLAPIISFANELVSASNAARELGTQTRGTVDDLEALDGQFGKTEASVDSLAAKMVNELFSATMNLDQAVLGVAESLTRLDATFDTNGKAIDKHTGLIAMNTEKGQANREAVLAAVTANMQMYQAQLSAGMGADAASRAYEDNTAALEAQLHKAGLTAAQIDDLVGKYRGIPKRVDTAIAIEGLTKAINDLAELIRQINGIHDKTVYVTVKQVGDNPKGQSHTGGVGAQGAIRRAASGMIVPPVDPGWMLMGEPQTGGEALIPLRGISQMRAAGLLNTAAAGYGLAVGPAGGGMPQTLQVAATFVLPTGEVSHRQLITYALNTGRTPAQLFPDKSR